MFNKTKILGVAALCSIFAAPTLAATATEYALIQQFYNTCSQASTKWGTALTASSIVPTPCVPLALVSKTCYYPVESGSTVVCPSGSTLVNPNGCKFTHPTLRCPTNSGG